MHLGISAFYHDSAAALVSDDGRILAAAQEERFTRKRHDPSWPTRAVEFCLAQANMTPQELKTVTFYEKPLLKFNRIADGYLQLGDAGYEAFANSFPKWVTGKIHMADQLIDHLADTASDVDWAAKLRFVEHHLSHAASAFYPSPFDEALVLTLDGVGEYATTTVAHGKNNTLRMLKQIEYPHSLGLVYSAFTYYTGFKVNSGEYKMMGLAPYGSPRFKDLILEKILHLESDGSFRVETDLFDSFAGRVIINEAFEEIFGAPRRAAHDPMTQHTMDVAASAQAATEEAVLHLARHLREAYDVDNLCLAGGVSLNCVANARVRNELDFSEVWVQPAAGDAGGALGAALHTYYRESGAERVVFPGDSMSGAYLGPEFSVKEVEDALDEDGATFESMGEDALIERAAQALADGKTLAFHQGRMEFGPRALGARSILADPRRVDMQKRLNLEVKKRESFRPFAPAMLEEELANWYEAGRKSPYMVFIDKLLVEKKGAADLEGVEGLDKLRHIDCEVPAVTHVDDTARIQTVSADTNPKFHALLKRFFELTGCPILVNTSFNVRGEPIVNSPSDAYRTFLNTDLDHLVVWPCFMTQDEQNPLNRMRYMQSFPDD